MWESEEDMLRDFCAINACDFPTDEELHNRFHSNKLEYNLQRKDKNVWKNIDPRNGEIINEKDLLYDSADSKNVGRGRGKLIKSNKQSELQKQLRMAKPFGFSNEIIESHYSHKRNLERGNASESNSKLLQTNKVLQRERRGGIFNSNDFPPLSSNKGKSVKAVRNSKMQNNALMSSLTSRLEESSKHS